MVHVKSAVFSIIMTYIVVLSVAIAGAGTIGDINSDDKIGLVESIYALKVASGVTGEGFQEGDLLAKTFYTVIEESSGGQICVIEFEFVAPTSLKGSEWQYVTDDTWIKGCLEEYIPDEEALLPYQLTNGVLEITFPDGEDYPVWPVRLVTRFSDNFLTSDPDGTSTWYFDKETVDKKIDPKVKFTQDILSANPWYTVETYLEDPENPSCNGRFMFDGNITMNVQWDEEGAYSEFSGVYALHSGSVITVHDQKVETETIHSYTPERISTIKSVIRNDGSTGGTGTVKIWFKNKVDAESYLNSVSGGELCFPSENLDG